MKNAITCIAASVLGIAANAAPLQLQPPAAGDLHAPAVRAAANPDLSSAAAKGPAMARDKVALSWAAGETAPAAPSPHLALSRESYASVTGAELARGVTIHTSAARAVVRLQALDGTPSAQAIGPAALTIGAPGGKRYAKGAGMELLVSEQQLARAELPFAPGTSAFRLRKDLGSGAFTLQAPGLPGNARYLLNVVEPDSPYALAMQTGAPAYLHGQELVVQAELQERGAARHAIDRLQGQVVSPAGRSFPLTFRPDGNGSMLARLALDADEAAAPGLWEVQAEATARAAGKPVRRSLRLAFAAALPVARLDGSAQLDDGAAARLHIGVEAAAAGRYELRSVLASTATGKAQPIAVLNAAQWLEPGKASIALDIDPALLAGHTGPFVLQDLQLMDQGAIALLHRQQHALAFSAPGWAQLAAAKAAPAQQRSKQAPDATPR